MAKRILVAYGTWCGATKGVAEAVAQTLTELGLSAEARPAADVRDVSDFSALVLGTAIHAGQVHPSAKAFVKRNRQAITRVPVAYFVDCLTMKEDTEENRATVRGYLEAFARQAPGVKPVSVGLFAGALGADTPEYHRLGFLWRWIIGSMAKKHGGDYRDWEGIRAWAKELVPLLAVR